MASAPPKAVAKPVAPPARAVATVPAKKPGTAVTTYKQRLAEAAKKAVEQEASVSTGSFFTLPAGVLTYQGAAMPNNETFVVVLDSIMENNYYNEPFDPKNPKNPTCFAFGRDDKEMRAHEASEEPQGAENNSCQGCEHNEWGTATNARGEPTKGKACQQRRKLMMIPVDALKGGVAGINKADVAFFKLSVTSVKNWAVYVKTLAAQYEMPPFGFVTKIKVERDSATQHQILFSADGEIESQEILEALEAKAAKHQSDLFRPYEKREEAPPPARAAKPAAKRKF